MDAKDGPFGRKGPYRPMDMGRNDQTFKPTPGPAQPEMAQAIDKSGDGGFGHRLQHQPEQAAGAGEITLPQGVTGVAFQTRVQDAGDFRARRQPARQRQARFLVARQPDRKGAQAPQPQPAVKGGQAGTLGVLKGAGAGVRGGQPAW